MNLNNNWCKLNNLKILEQYAKIRAEDITDRIESDPRTQKSLQIA